MTNLYQNLFAGAFLAAGIGYEAMALSMPLGGFASPGPGLFPVIVGGALILTSAACLVQNLVAKAPAAPPLDDAPSPVPAATVEPHKAWLLVAALILYVVALKPVGFPVALTLLLAASVRIFGYRSWLRNIPLSVLMTVIAYVVFIVWLKVPLPLGILAGLLD